MGEILSIPNYERYLDIDAALSRMRGNKKLYRRMLMLFTQSKEFDTFEEHLAKNDLAGAADVAHAIKGMTGNLTMTALFEESAQLMVQLRDGVYDDATIARYREALEKTKACVEEFMAQGE